jgi:SAM-dependent methyltransferase
MDTLQCRSCSADLSQVVVDLGSSPLSNAFLSENQLGEVEPFYPLKAYVCGRCLLMQIKAFEPPETIFQEYAYFSSFSESWLEHCRRYAQATIERFALGAQSRVVEIASNDGYLLRFFRDAGVPVLGVEPARNVAEVALQRGVPTVTQFLGRKMALVMAEQGQHADLLIGNNVLAHVPDLNDFVAGLAILLKPHGVLSLEFPHVQELLARGQFDTIYHEHFCYFSLLSASSVLARHGLDVFDVERIPTHGGSLRVFASHRAAARERMKAAPAELIAAERQAGLDQTATYCGLEARARAAKRSLLRFLIEAREQGKSVAGYGAPAKGNTLLNYCGIRHDLLEYTVDLNPYKQGRYLPGTRVPIFAPEKISETKPDYVLILPWNLRDEVVGQLSHIRQWGGRFVVPIPSVEVIA